MAESDEGNKIIGPSCPHENESDDYMIDEEGSNTIAEIPEYTDSNDDDEYNITILSDPKLDSNKATAN